jgi:hypothetical protein
VFGGAADADAQHARRAPAAHLGQHFQNQSTIESLGFIILNFDLFSPPPLAATSTEILLPLDHVDMERRACCRGCCGR